MLEGVGDGLLDVGGGVVDGEGDECGLGWSWLVFSFWGLGKVAYPEVGGALFGERVAACESFKGEHENLFERRFGLVI